MNVLFYMVGALATFLAFFIGAALASRPKKEAGA